MTMQTEEQAVLVTTIDTILGPSPPSSLLFGAPAISARQVENATHRKSGTLTEALLLQAATEVGNNRGKDAVLKTLQQAGQPEVWVIFRPGTGKPKTAHPIKTLQLLAPPTAGTAMPTPGLSPAKSANSALWNKLLHRKPEPNEKPPEKIKIQLPAPHALASNDFESMGIPIITQSVDSVEGIPRSEVAVPLGNITNKAIVSGGESKAHLKASSTPALRLPTPTRPNMHRSPASSPTPVITPKPPALRAPPPRTARPVKPITPLIKPKTPIGQAPGLVISLSDCDSDASEESPFALDLDVRTGASLMPSAEDVYGGMGPAITPSMSTATTAAHTTHSPASVAAVAHSGGGVPKNCDASDMTHEQAGFSNHQPDVDVMKKALHLTEKVKPMVVKPEEAGRESGTPRKDPKRRGPSPQRQDLNVTQMSSKPHRPADGRHGIDASKEHRPASERSREPPSGEKRSKSHSSSDLQKSRQDGAHASRSRSEDRSSSKSKRKSSSKTEQHKRSRDRQSAPPPTPWADVAFQDMPFRVHFPVAKVSLPACSMYGYK